MTTDSSQHEAIEEGGTHRGTQTNPVCPASVPSSPLASKSQEKTPLDTETRSVPSSKKSEQNRKNAQKSTGPKTPEGKEAAKMNAIIHGILSTHLFIPTGGDTTDIKGFTDFTGLFFEEMQPEGIVETLLVDRLLATFWRIRRLHIAETGFIRKQVELHYVQQAVDKFSAEGNARKDIEHGFFRRMRTSMGCTHLAYGWQAVAETIQEKGLPLSKGMTRSIIEKLGGNSGFWMAEYVSQFNWIMQNKEGSKPMSAEEEEKFTAYTLDFAKQLSGMFKAFAEILEDDEEKVRKADLQSKMIPPPAELERIQRYDAHLQRVFMSTLHELQRMQALRLGKPSPPSAALDITLNSDGNV